MTTAPFTIRTLAYGDLPQVIAIERRSFPTPWSLAMFVLELSKPSSICLAAVEEDGTRTGRLVGYTVCSRYAEVWHVMNIAVDPPWGRQGIGTALLTALIERAGADESYTLEVRPSNSGAIALYERFGFRSAGTRARYYRDTGEDALIMWRTPHADAEPAASPAAGSEGPT
jgi:[ribosomal protein S18]-alanine N-acetyltransferase